MLRHLTSLEDRKKNGQNRYTNTAGASHNQELQLKILWKEKSFQTLQNIPHFLSGAGETHTQKLHSKPKIPSVYWRLIRQTRFFFCRFLTENYFLSSKQIKYKLLCILFIGCIPVFTQSSHYVNITWFIWSVIARQHWLWRKYCVPSIQKLSWGTFSE